MILLIASQIFEISHQHELEEYNGIDTLLAFAST